MSGEYLQSIRKDSEDQDSPERGESSLLGYLDAERKCISAVDRGTSALTGTANKDALGYAKRQREKIDILESLVAAVALTTIYRNRWSSVRNPLNHTMLQAVHWLFQPQSQLRSA